MGSTPRTGVKNVPVGFDIQNKSSYMNISSLLCLVPPHLRLAPRKDHAREFVNLIKKSGGKQEAAAKWINRVSLFTGFAARACTDL